MTRGREARFRFVGGKGGVGKTTCAAAAAMGAAEQGRRVLVISTDPAHSLGDALGRRLSARPARVPTRRGALHAAELDADRALERWIARRRGALREIAERGTYLDAEDCDRLFGLSLPGVDELVGLVELERVAAAGDYEQVVVDTAPTGHTLRLLAMPETLHRIAHVLDDMQGKQRVIAESLGRGWRRDESDALIDEVESSARGLEARLRDPERSTLSWVLLPEAMALAETRDAVRALERAALPVADLIVNRVRPPPDRGCTLCTGRAAAERAVLDEARAEFRGRTLRLVPALDAEPRGPAALREVARALDAPARLGPRPTAARRVKTVGRGARTARSAGAGVAAPSPWLAALDPPGLRLLVFGGKGGVGKTTCAAATAIALARAHPRRRILLLSTDPAHSLADVLGVELDDDERRVGRGALSARELDAERAFSERRERYRDAVDELFDGLRGGSRFDAAYDRAVVQDLIDLAPPGLDELFAMTSLIDALLPDRGEPPRFDTVVLDTAPTGHALRLLALPAAALEWVHALLAILLKYRRVIGLGELATDLVEAARGLRELQVLLRDAARTRFIAVTRPAELPRLETARLLGALGELGIPIGALIVNAVTPAGCPRCRRAASQEARAIAAVARGSSRAAGRRVILLAPAEAPPPRTPAGLQRFGDSWSRLEGS